ncbi:hypothetical protein J7426_07070 [Tropicibacter sp. R16_0]|uniref:hypothetical protein n=1 Tax=Tropicibacter sp. R16_0 TaxID=2821102 RepID=UPI001ADD3DD3|nr:hypothetical protein [Tropicibacter sp. R16_0]MBO9450009.1 hypothetical protein [Tropicibacter sp. R16_0]
MFLPFVFRSSSINPMHSPDLTDMRRAILEEDDDGPDGGFHMSRHAEPNTATAAQSDLRRPM